MKKSIFNINIYKPERKKKKEWKLPYKEIYSGIMILISLFLLFIVSIYLFFVLHIPQERNLKKALSKAKEMDLKLQETKAEAISLAEKKKLYLQIREESVSWPEKLVALSQNLSEKIWFSSITFSGRADTNKGGQDLLILGQTFSSLSEENLDQIGDLIIGLNRAETFKRDFEPLRLEYTQKSETEWGVIQFRIIGKAKDLSL
ncbi:MAG: hypothetical protein ACMUHX_00620 [bacterium]